MLHQAGFESVELVAETGFNSSPKTKGTLFRAKKPVAIEQRISGTTVDESLEKYQSFIDNVYAEGALDRKTKHLIALGAALATGCEPLAKYLVSVARQLSATDEELKETMTLAMAVGATKIGILQENSLSPMLKEDYGNSAVLKKNEAANCDETGST